MFGGYGYDDYFFSPDDDLERTRSKYEDFGNPDEEDFTYPNLATMQLSQRKIALEQLRNSIKELETYAIELEKIQPKQTISRLDPLHQSAFERSLPPRESEDIIFDQAVEESAVSQKANIVKELAASLKKTVDSLQPGEVDAKQNKDFITLLHSKDKELSLYQDKDSLLKRIFVNIGLALVGLGIGYVVAGLINLKITQGKHFVFFNKTRSEEKQENVENDWKNLAKIGR